MKNKQKKCFNRHFKGNKKEERERVEIDSLMNKYNDAGKH